MRAGRPGIVADQLPGPDAHARLVRSRVIIWPERSPVTLACGRLRRVSITHSRVSPFPDASPSSSSRRWHHYDLTCASASCTRDRPAWSNQSPSTENYEHDPFVRTTGPTAVRSDTPARLCLCKSVPAPVVSQAPLLRFSSPATLTGCARAIRGGQPPDDPASAFPSCRRPARVLSSDLPTRWCSFALAVFRSSGFVAMKLAWRTCVVQSVGTESVARAARVGTMRPVYASVSAARRSVALTFTSSAARAGEIGETDPSDIHQAQAHRPPDVHINVVTLARDPYHPSVVAKTPPPITGHSPNRAFFAWRSATRSSIAQPGRTTRRSSLLHSSSSDGVPGVQHALRRFNPSAGWTRYACFRATDLSTPSCFIGRHLCRSGPTCRSCLCFRPDDFRRGDRSPVGVTGSAKAIGRGCGWRRLLGFDSRLWSVSSAHVWLKRRSCLGLCLLQGCRAPAPFHNGRRASAGLDPATDHQPPVRRRLLISSPAIPIRSWACSTFPSHHAARLPSRASCRRDASGCVIAKY